MKEEIKLLKSKIIDDLKESVEYWEKYQGVKSESGFSIHR